MIEVEEVSFSYPGGHPILRSLSIRIGKGEFVAIMGRNGTGKSTLARLLNGLLIPDRGRVKIQGRVTAEQGNLSLIRRQVALLMAEPAKQLIAGTVEEELAFAPENMNLPPEEIEKRITTALKLVSMEDYKKYPPDSLSGGQQQRVLLAAFLTTYPDYLILDEPFSFLDFTAKREMLEILTGLHREKGMGILLITNRLEEAVLADRMLVLDEGRLAFDGTPDALLAEKDLERWGIELPEISRIAQSLSRSGCLPADAVMSQRSELVEDICRLYCKR